MVPDATFRSTTTRKSERRADRIVGSSASGREWRERRRDRVSWVKAGRKGVLGPAVERMRVRVWKKRQRRWGMKKALYEGAVEL